MYMIFIFLCFSENVVSLLSNQSFDTLISSIQEKVNSQANTDYNYEYSSQGNKLEFEKKQCLTC
jgi:hypothetical protein